MSRGERWATYRCVECGWQSSSAASMHGCVSCLSRREPELVDVVPASELREAEEERDRYQHHVEGLTEERRDLRRQLQEARDALERVRDALVAAYAPQVGRCRCDLHPVDVFDRAVAGK